MGLPMVQMGNNVFEVGAFDAKTYFSELLRKVQDGAVFNISKNGKQVAVLQGKKTIQNQQFLQAHTRILERSKKFQKSRESQGTAPITTSELKELKNAGRKY